MLLFNFHPATAVGTDLLYASATKSVGTAVHGRHGTVDWSVVRRLATGSLPAAIITLLIIGYYKDEAKELGTVISLALGVLLIISGLLVQFRVWAVARMRALVGDLDERTTSRYTIIMGDSHTCTHGAFGAFAAGIGTTDLEVGILKGVCAFHFPKTIKIVLTGELQPGVYAKDLILFIIKELTVNGATNMVIEFTGPVVDAMSMESRMTLCNMAIEAGGTCVICYPDMTTVDYLWDFIQDEFATKEDALADYSKWVSDDDAEYERVLEYDVSTLQPMVTVGFKPDQVKTVAEMTGTKVDQIYIGSCTNGRIEDLRIAAEVLKGKKISDNVRAIVSPATPAIYSMALKEGIIEIFQDAGFCVTNPTCGACLGMSNGVLAEGEVCASTTNRNFNGRMGKGGMVHLMSPASAAAAAISGTIENSFLYKA